MWTVCSLRAPSDAVGGGQDLEGSAVDLERRVLHLVDQIVRPSTITLKASASDPRASAVTTACLVRSPSEAAETIERGGP